MKAPTSLPSSTGKQRVAEGFLMSSRAGQFQHVLDDLRKLLPPAETFVQAVAKAYHSQQGKIVSMDGAKVLLHNVGEVDDKGYLDPKSKNILKVNALGEVVSTDKDSGKTRMEATLEPARVELEQAVAGYVAAHYATEAAASAVYAWEEALHVVIYGERLNLRNFWSGSWLSVWEIKDKQLSGTIKLRAHYFEEGNVQMQTTKTLPATSLPPTEDETTAAVAVVDAIQQAEATVQWGLEAMYNNLADEGFRTLRRKLPLSKIRMDWSRSASTTHQLSRTLNNSRG